MHKNLYPENIKTTYLRKPAYRRLDSVSQRAGATGIGIW